MMRKSSSGRTLFETVIILSLVGIFIGVAINRFMADVLEAKESLLHSELINIRMSVELYKVINGKYPENLGELTKSNYMQTFSEDTIINKKYLKTTAATENGTPLDPFGKEYFYNKNTGEIKCLTKGYEGW